MAPAPARKTPQRLVRIVAAAEYADCSTRTIRRYVAEGRITAYRFGPRLVKIDLDEIDALTEPLPTVRMSAPLPESNR